MRWKQYLIPVQAMTADQAKKFMEDQAQDEFTLVDVRQPEEYEDGHIPGAKLIPLPELDTRMSEIRTDRKTIVYCATGGRSRVASQMIADKGVGPIFDLAGGYRSWIGGMAFGGEGQGLAFFSGKESPAEVLVAAYSLEMGLQEFYLSMAQQVANESARSLFKKLAGIEVKHQERIFNQYCSMTDGEISRDEFKAQIVSPAMEGGLTTEEYADLYLPDWESAADIVEIAMGIEAQALDLYLRVSAQIRDAKAKEKLMQIAAEEREHLARLGKMMAQVR